MIKGIELLTNCTNEIKQVASGLESKYGTIIITSGYRSPEYNKSIGGAKDSQHVLGKAIDICVVNVACFKVAAWAVENYPKIKGVGLDLFKNYCHLDVRDSNKLITWPYDKNGKAIN